ncbi:MAG TPA: glycoside hydrolase family 3 N-terminal domain-containing protein [Aggregatilineaceae bacterium]|nr:glycoside hydrolase family 3 N-terminal domain-containing protein [Aggregatilineaceae bacterium]
MTESAPPQQTMSPAVYLDPSRPIAERVRDLLSRLTLDEKIGQMRNQTQAIPRLNIPAYDFWSEALHGVAGNGRATVFPQAIGMAATWDPELIQKIASAVGDEARAKHHEALRRKGSTGMFQGLTVWSPNINIFRDPRWGRGQETWGEDPFLTGEMGAAYVRGLQGAHPKYLKVAACAKHFAVHSGPEKLRHVFNAKVSPRDLHATYLPAFKKLVTEAGVEAVMGAYNRTNDEPCCASQLLLVDTLRGDWAFQGHVVSDCSALTDFHRGHKVTKDVVESAALALKAGCDLSCLCTYDHLGEAIDRGLITEADIDHSLERTLTTRFKLGLFDPPADVPFAAIPMSVVGSAEHCQLAYEAAVKSIVLLKNKNNVLPITEQAKKILVVGPTAANIEVLLGNYHGLNDSLTTLIQGLVARAPEGVSLQYRPACPLSQRVELRDWSVLGTPDADVIIACMGLSPLLESEESDACLSDENGDRAQISLPPIQIEYLTRLAIGGAKVVLVLTGGSPIALGDLEDLMEAVVYVWYPGQEGGKAVADVLFGDVVPSGKLPLTFPKSLEQLPPFEDYNMTGRTYRYATEEPLYPFGFGLSYTHFTYSDLAIDKSIIRAGESLPFHCTLTNSGELDAEEVAQIYLSDLEASTVVPLYSLIGFQRVHLKPGERTVISFTITPEMMEIVNDAGDRVLEPGEFRVMVGGCSPSERGVRLGASAPVSTTFTVSA